MSRQYFLYNVHVSFLKYNLFCGTIGDKKSKYNFLIVPQSKQSMTVLSLSTINPLFQSTNLKITGRTKQKKKEQKRQLSITFLNKGFFLVNHYQLTKITCYFTSYCLCRDMSKNFSLFYLGSKGIWPNGTENSDFTF